MATIMKTILTPTHPIIILHQVTTRMIRVLLRMNIIFISRVVNNLKANVAMVHMVEVDKEKLWMTFAGKTNKENGVLIVDGGCNNTVCGNGFRPFLPVIEK